MGRYDCSILSLSFILQRGGLWTLHYRSSPGVNDCERFTIVQHSLWRTIHVQFRHLGMIVWTYDDSRGSRQRRYSQLSIERRRQSSATDSESSGSSLTQISRHHRQWVRALELITTIQCKCAFFAMPHSGTTTGKRKTWCWEVALCLFLSRNALC